MIIVRAPMRIPLGGGGTDLPSYYSRFGGQWISAAINKYVYIALHKRFGDSIRVSYSKTEVVEHPNELQHPIVREALKLLKIDGGIEIVSISDMPAHTGLGSSGAFTVALLTALHVYLRDIKRIPIPSEFEIAQEACHIAMDILKEPSGKQDEYIAACGGIAAFNVDTAGAVSFQHLYCADGQSRVFRELAHNLLFFYTGLQRESWVSLKLQKEALERSDASVVESLHRIKAVGQEVRKALVGGDLHHFGELLDLHWQEKVKREGVTNLRINEWYELAKKNGAIGGKLIGAGLGGFLLLYCEGGKERVRQVMREAGLIEKQFAFDTEGAKVIANMV